MNNFIFSKIKGKKKKKSEEKEKGGKTCECEKGSLGLEGVWEDEGLVFGLASLPSHKTKIHEGIWFVYINNNF